ncbi:MAG: outer membrane protein assembly factor BamD [Myxococcales bacterium]|nr:outer membrane protein assembly factor BamD [Myxococcales bacterium]
MSEHDLPELDPELRALLATESDLLEPPDGALERVFERVGRTVLDPSGGDPSDDGGDGDASGEPDAGAPGTPGGEPAGPPGHPPSAAAPSGGASAAPGASVPAAAASSATGMTLSVPVIAALAFLGGVGAGALGMRATAPPPEVRVETRTVEVPVRVVETVYVPAAPADGGQADAASAQGAAEAGTRPARTNAANDTDAAVVEAPGPARDRDLADENALVTRAQAALARGRVSEALAATAEHQRRFPRGEFVEEREALAIQALARAGRVDAAVARAERFRARYPRSMLRRAVDAAVGEHPAP